jgi:UDP-galactopyranose mutase
LDGWAFVDTITLWAGSLFARRYRMAGYDYLVVGCGMFGAVFARSVADRGRRVLVVDKRPHIAGNCFSENVAGVEVHRYGPHIFHTDNPRVWWFVTRFARFNDYRHRGCVSYQGRRFSFPLNLTTLEQLWGVTTPEDAERKLAEVRVAHEKPRNLRDWIVSQVGVELYEIFVRGYTTKQWGRDPAELPASIIRRLPIRTTRNDSYFDDRFQGIPIGGYTQMFERMLDHGLIDVRLSVDYFADRVRLDRLAARTVYTGKIDELFDYCHGELEYRSLRFENQILDQRDYQGAAIVNYTDQAVPFTRITEHKHFECGPGGVTTHPAAQTVITREYPSRYQRGETPYYPIRDDVNAALYERYRQLAEQSNVLVGGRLGTYQYYDMHQVVAQAMAMAQRETGRTTTADAQHKPAA